MIQKISRVKYKQNHLRYQPYRMSTNIKRLKDIVTDVETIM